MKGVRIMGLSQILKKSDRDTFQVFNDDINVIRSIVEYAEDNKTMKYIIYELEMMDNNGEMRHFYKAVKLLRVIRLPKSAKQSTSFMEMHTQVLAGVWERDVNFITIIANMIKPVPLGLLFLYGVQGIAEELEVAKKIADDDFAGLSSLLQGTYRTMEFRILNYEEVEWLREKMYSMKHISVVRGLPKPRMTGTDAGNTGFGGQNLNPDSQDTTEEFIAGMSDREYVVQILSSPVSEEALEKWLQQTAKQLSIWNSQLTGVKNLNFGISIPMMYMGSLGASSGWSHSYTDAETVGHAESMTEGISTTENFSQSTSETVGTGTSTSQTVGNSFTENVSQSDGVSTSEGVNHNVSVGENSTISHTDTESASSSLGHSEGSSYTVGQGLTNTQTESVTNTETSSTSQTSGHSDSTSSSTSDSSSTAFGVNNSQTNTHTEGTTHSSSKSNTVGGSVGQSMTVGVSVKGGIPLVGSGSVNVSGTTSVSADFSTGNTIGESHTSSDAYSHSTGTSNTYTNGTTVTSGTSTTINNSTSITNGKSTSTGYSDSSSKSVSESWGKTSTDSVTNTKGNSSSDGWSKGISSTETVGTSKTQGTSSSVSHGYSKGQTQTEGVTHSSNRSVSTGTTQGYSKGSTSTTGQTNSWGTSKGTSRGTTGGTTTGSSATLGVGPSMSYSKSYQWLDMEVQNIITLLEFQNNRLMKALNGNGAFFSDVYIATEDEESCAASKMLAKSTWHNENALICPLQVMDLSQEEQSHLLYHFNAFSADTAKEGIPGTMESYRYSTILLPEEYSAYTHPPRISEGGVFADVNDIPKFSVPSMRKGEIYMGKILSGERYTQRWGYCTPFDYRIASDELMHGFFTGESRSGKTVAATRFIAELATKVVRKDSGKRLRIVCMDPKQDWRVLAKFIEPERFHFYSLGNPEFMPINLNICKIPKNVYPQQWIDGVIEIYCRAYGLGERGKSVLSETFYQLYEEAGVFVPNWREVAPERSKSVTLPRIYERMRQIKVELEDPRLSGKGRVGNDVRDAYARVLDRLQVFGRPFSIEAQLFGREDGKGIDDLIGKDDVVVLESYGLETTFKNFVFGVVTAGFFKYAQAHEGGFKASDQYETVLVIEEANEVLTGESDNGDNPLKGQSEFEKILDQSAGLGLFIFSITQKIADMPSSIIANSGLVFAGKISRVDDVTTVIRKIGREERYEDRDLAKWFPRSPIGWFVCRSSMNFDFKENEPVLVKIAHLNVDPPSNEDLLHIIARKEAKKQQLLASSE
jgi:hypothetical protein